MASETHQEEVTATRRIRDRNPDMGAAMLARKIVAKDLTVGTEQDLFSAGTGVPYYTVYSRIRRYDAKRKQVAVCM